MQDLNQTKNKKNQTASASSTKKDKLKDLSQLVSSADPLEDPKPGQAKAQDPVKQVSTGCISKIGCFFTNLVLKRKKWKSLTADQILLLTEALDAIEVQYCPAVLSKYGEKWAPLANLSMVLFMVYNENKPPEPVKPEESQEEPKEEKPANQ